MVAAQVFIALCAASITVAAPQLNLPGLRSVTPLTSNVNEEQLISGVVTALGPSISQAVADALASFEAAAAGEEATRLGAEQQAQEEAEARAEVVRLSAKQRAAAEQGASQRAAAEQATRERAVTAAAQLAALPTAKPVYNFEYKVADNDEQSYISRKEERDGDILTGTYSYVNPLGSLITVNYKAGPLGYTQTSSEQAGFVAIRAQPVRSNAAAEEASRFAAQQAAAEQRAQAKAEQRAVAEAARFAAEQRAAAEAAKLAAEATKLAAEQRAAVEAERLAVEQRAAAESARLAAEQRAAEEAARHAAEQRAAEEVARLAAEQRAAEEAARLAAEKRVADEAARLAAEQKAADEAARLAAEQAASQQSLILRIISSLQPQISSAVQSAISTTQSVAVPAPVAPVAAAVASQDLSGTFGNGFSVKIDTPVFNVEY